MRFKQRIAGCVLALGLVFPAVSSAFDCPVSVPTMGDPPGTLGSSTSRGWYGTYALAALIPRDGKWTGMGPGHGYRDKFWWWREGYYARSEPLPDLVVTAEKLPDASIQTASSKATNASGGHWDAMLVLLEFPSPGCWRVTGRYQDERLQVILKVGD